MQYKMGFLCWTNIWLLIHGLIFHLVAIHRWEWQWDCCQIETRPAPNIDWWSDVLARLWFRDIQICTCSSSGMFPLRWFQLNYKHLSQLISSKLTTLFVNLSENCWAHIFGSCCWQPLVNSSCSYVWTIYLTYMASLQRVSTD